MNVASAKLNSLKKRDIRVLPTDPTYSDYEQDTDVDLDFQTTVMDPMFASLNVRLAEEIGTTSSDADMSTDVTIASRYLGETAIANFMNDAIVSRSSTFPEGEVDFAAFNASGVASGVPLGSSLTYNDWYSVMPYADVIRTITMTGAQIKDMLNSNAKRIVRSEELADADLSGFISRGGFLHFSGGIKYTINTGSSVSDAKASDITLKGEDIETVLTKEFKVAFSDYIAGGNEGWKGANIGAGLPDGIIGYDIASMSYKDTGLIYRNELIEYIRSVGGVVSPDTGAVKDGRVTITN